MNKKNSFFMYAVLVFLFNLLYGVVFFKYIYDENKLALEGFFSFMYIGCVLIGFTLTYKKRRTIWSAITIVSIPYGLYCFFAYPGTGSIVTSVFVAISIGFVAADIFIKRFPRNSDKELITMIRVKKLIHKTHYLTAFFSLMLICIVLVSNILSPNTQNSNSLEKQSEISFSLDEWEKADIDMKEEYAQSLVNFECSKLNIKSLTLITKKMPKSRLAYYSDSQNRVVLNLTHLKNDNLLEVLNTIAHECFHSLEYSLIRNGTNYNGTSVVDENISKKIFTYRTEFTDYKEYNSEKALSYKEYYDYYFQTCEYDARTYGDCESLVLYKLILSNG